MITARGPFAEADERKLLSEKSIEAIVTKNSGGAATRAKLVAARALGIRVIMVARPDVPDVEHGYKFNQHFNINPADFYTFLDFEEKVHLPEMKRFGVTIAGGWNVAVGATPYVIDETRADNLEVIGEMLQNPAYQSLTLQLLQLVSNYGCKILVPSGHINI